MTSPAWTFKVAQEAALRGSLTLRAAMGLTISRVYTETPTNAPTPYVVIGDDQILIENDPCAIEAEVFSTLHLWSLVTPRDRGAQARAMGSAIIAALNAALTLDGWVIDEWEMQSERYLTDPDDSTHGIIEFRYQLTQLVD